MKAIEEIAEEVTFRPKYLDNLIVVISTEQITSESGILSLNGVVMIEDLGLAELNMSEVVRPWALILYNASRTRLDSSTRRSDWIQEFEVNNKD